MTDCKKNGIVTIIYTIMHFLVDLTTVYFITGVILGYKTHIAQQSAVIILYNLVAFAGQLPLGILSDIINKNPVFVASGCLLSFLAYPLASLVPWVSCFLVALGNAAFHIGAGADVLRFSMPKARASGLFVSSGALGVYLAYNLQGEFLKYVLPGIMLICFVVAIVIQKLRMPVKSISIEFKTPSMSVIVAVTCFMLTIVIRSLLGMTMNFSWKVEPLLALISVWAVVIGKFFGGYLGDKFGNIKTACISLVVSLCLFVFSFDYWLAGVIAVLCFNMTMPLTLTAIADLTDKKYGFAFGLTTFALAIGFVPVVFGAQSLFSISMLLIGVVSSLMYMIAGYLFMKKCR